MVTNVNLKVTIHKLFLVVLYGNMSVLGEQAHQGRCARPEGAETDCLPRTEWFTGTVTAGRDGGICSGGSYKIPLLYSRQKTDFFITCGNKVTLWVDFLPRANSFIL